MSTTKSDTKNINSLVVAITTFFCACVEQVEQKKGRIKPEDLLELLRSDDKQKELTKLARKEAPRQPREKKLVDPEAPKKPLSAYMHMVSAVRPKVTFDLKMQKLKEEQNKEKDKKKRALLKVEDMKIPVPEVSKIVGAMWKGMSDKDKAKYVKMAEKQKNEYQELIKDYVRPDDEVLANLKENQRKKRASKGTKPKRDPQEPKKSSAYYFFQQEMRPQVKAENPEMDSKAVTSELGRMWKDEYASVKNRVKWQEMADESKAEYDEAMKTYVTPDGFEPRKVRAKKETKTEEKAEKKTKNRPKKEATQAETEKKSRGRPKKSVEVVQPEPEEEDQEEKPEEDQEEDQEENQEPEEESKPVKSTASTPKSNNKPTIVKSRKTVSTVMGTRPSQQSLLEDSDSDEE